MKLNENKFKDFRYIFAISGDNETPPKGHEDEYVWYPDCSIEDCYDQCSSCKFTKEMRQNYFKYSINSKFALMIHGDSASSARLYEAISHGQIPIIISTGIFENALPFIRQVPWQDFCFFISPIELEIDEVVELIKRHVLETPLYILKHMHGQLLKYRRDVLWSHPESLVVEHILEEARDTCRL